VNVVYVNSLWILARLLRKVLRLRPQPSARMDGEPIPLY
jgi:hypothetical protein